jgi:hypothetical protein
MSSAFARNLQPGVSGLCTVSPVGGGTVSQGYGIGNLTRLHKEQ